jgi:hypothetical protein
MYTPPVFAVCVCMVCLCNCSIGSTVQLESISMYSCFCFIVPYGYQKGDVTVGITPASSAISPVSPSAIVSLFSYFRPFMSVRIVILLALLYSSDVSFWHVVPILLCLFAGLAGSHWPIGKSKTFIIDTAHYTRQS